MTSVKRSESAKEMWRKRSPEQRKAINKKLQEHANSEKQRQAASQRFTERWKDPVFREMMSQRSKERWSDPIFRQRVLGARPKGNTRILASVKGSCDYCGKDGTEWDHVIPLSRGGTNEASNKVPCCTRCNTSKGRLTGDEFRADLERRRLLTEKELT